MMDHLERAITMAVSAHKGQRDKSGAPYILHPLRVMMRMTRKEEQIVGVLHDVVEDTPVTLDDLEREGFPSNVLEAVNCLTQRKGESYEDYLGRVISNPLAMAVKRADLEDNMDIKRLSTNPGERDWERLTKYRRTWARLYSE